MCGLSRLVQAYAMSAPNALHTSRLERALCHERATLMNLGAKFGWPIVANAIFLSGGGPSEQDWHHVIGRARGSKNNAVSS